MGKTIRVHHARQDEAGQNAVPTDPEPSMKEARDAYESAMRNWLSDDTELPKGSTTPAPNE